MTSAHPTTRLRRPVLPTAADFPAPAVDRASLNACGSGHAAADAEALFALADKMLGPEDLSLSASRMECLRAITSWLGRFPGTTWQERWLASNIEDGPWAKCSTSDTYRWRLGRGAIMLICCGVLHPDDGWLLGRHFVDLYRLYPRADDPDGFARLARLMAEQGADDRTVNQAQRTLVRLRVATAKPLAELTAQDLINHYWKLKAVRHTTPLETLWRVLHDQGMIKGPARLKAAVKSRRLDVEGLVDRHALQCRPVRDVIVAYLRHRAPGLDYGSLSNLTHHLAELFWGDLERHHPGIDSLHLSPQVVEAWKQRMTLRPDGRPRAFNGNLLTSVRAFYADINHWAYEEPERWARWAAPSPITKGDVAALRKHKSQVTARMQARTRTLAPVLPQLVATVRTCREHSRDLLAAARNAAADTEFTVDGRSYRRVANAGAQALRILVLPLPADGSKPFDTVKEERESFWAWAVIEVLRLSGLRIEELMELTHLSIRRYTQPSGEVVPLLQVAPSKLDAERVFPITPELAHVLAQIIERVRTATGIVPAVSRFDSYERVYGPTLPHLFQRPIGSGHQVFNSGTLRACINRTLAHTPLHDTDGTPLHFTPHDFRRLFATEVVNSGLPIHIAAAILGHRQLDTTRGYAAVYPEEIITTYQTYIHTRRQDRPGEEYREPTETEWRDFEQHFTLRKVAYGNCDRPYGTPCAHEHACIRCPMLRAEPSRLPLLRELEVNLDARITEARGRQWLGEVSGLEQTLIALRAKKDHVEHLIDDGVEDIPAAMA
ncbi:tyrosine-type recombinase/integrase [Streptomyces sp. NPDC102384]|uniref:tyrosine-type recombinase/integrase n=1 Tax=Streptomyces sp. NPDC102384 TaxID=3366166 RepID=UPI00380409F3